MAEFLATLPAAAAICLLQADEKAEEDGLLSTRTIGRSEGCCNYCRIGGICRRLRMVLSPLDLMAFVGIAALSWKQ